MFLKADLEPFVSTWLYGTEKENYIPTHRNPCTKRVISDKYSSGENGNHRSHILPRCVFKEIRNPGNWETTENELLLGHHRSHKTLSKSSSQFGVPFDTPKDTAIGCVPTLKSTEHFRAIYLRAENDTPDSFSRRIDSMDILQRPADMLNRSSPSNINRRSPSNSPGHLRQSPRQLQASPQTTNDSPKSLTRSRKLFMPSPASNVPSSPSPLQKTLNMTHPVATTRSDAVSCKDEEPPMLHRSSASLANSSSPPPSTSDLSQQTCESRSEEPPGSTPDWTPEPASRTSPSELFPPPPPPPPPGDATASTAGAQGRGDDAHTHSEAKRRRRRARGGWLRLATRLRRRDAAQRCRRQSAAGDPPIP